MISYLGLRKAIGVIGISLPFVLVIGDLLLEHRGIQSSISDYYYTDMRNVFVGSLFSISVFLMSYHGYTRVDDIAGDLAGVCGIGVALFPTTPSGDATHTEQVIGTCHFIFAAGFFLTLAFFSLVLFPRTNTPQAMTAHKYDRNIIYYISGIVILICIILIAVVMKYLPATSPIQSFNPTFWLESIAVVAFGVSWFTKGQGILKD